MHRTGPLPSRSLSVLLSVPLLALTACPNEQVNPGGSAGITGVTSVTTVQLTTLDLPTTSGTSTGSSGAATTTTETSGTGTSAGTSTGEGTSTGVGASSGSSSGDSGLGGTGEGTTGTPPNLQDCFGCLCDINVSFCRIVFPAAQPAAFAGPDPHCPIVEADTEETGCVMYPADCGETPDCECLPNMDGACFCIVVGPGNFQIACPLP